MAKQANQTILVKASCLLAQSKIPNSFWAEAVNNTTLLSNLTPSNTRNMKIPYEMWTGRTFNFELPCPFGCLSYFLIPKELHQFKLNPTAERGIMLGYENDLLLYRIFKLEDKKIMHVRNIKFEEFNFPGLKEGKLEPNQLNSNVFDVAKTPEINDESTVNLPLGESNNKSTKVQVKSQEVENISTARRDISSQISTDNILSVDLRGNSFIVYLVENIENNTPASYIQAINSASSLFWKKAIDKEITNM